MSGDSSYYGAYYGASELELATKYCVKPVGVGFDPEGKAHLLRCKDRRHCPYCSKLEKNLLLQRIDRAFQPIIDADGEVGFTTLTVEFDGTDECRERINKDFSLYWRRFRATFWKRGIKFSYFKMIEFTQKNIKHIHLMTSPALDYFDVQEAWAHATRGSLIVESESVKDVRRVSHYLSKYLTKLTSYSLYSKHERIYSFSQNLREAIDLDKYDIIITPLKEVKEYIDLNGVSYTPEEAKEKHKKYVSVAVKDYKRRKDGAICQRKHKRLRDPWTVFVVPDITYEDFAKSVQKIESDFASINHFILTSRLRHKAQIAIKMKMALIDEIFKTESIPGKDIRKHVKKPGRRYS